MKCLRENDVSGVILGLKRPDRVAQLAEHWAGIPKVVGSFHAVARQIFQPRGVDVDPE